MKRTCIILATIAASLVFASCTDELFTEENGNAQSEGSRVIAVSFAPQTKTALGEDGLTPEFVGGESVLVSNDETTQECQVKFSSGKAIITTRLQGDLTAVYPASAAKLIKSEKTGEMIIDPGNVLISSTQDGTFASANICMATMKDGEEKMTFHNKTAILKFYVDKSIDVYYITVKGNGIAGENIDRIDVYDSRKRSLYEATDDPQKRICYVAVSPGVSASSLKFSAVTRTQETVTRTSSATDVTLEAGKMYNAFIPYYIKIGDQKWAYCNIGAFLPEEPGYFFSWGNTTGYVHNGTNWAVAPGYPYAGTVLEGGFSDSNYAKTEGKNLAGDVPSDAKNDAATAAFGQGWRMPSREEFDYLLNFTNTTASDFANGILSINGTALRFPAAGSGLGTVVTNEGSGGRYWTLSLDTQTTSDAFYLSFKNGEVLCDNYYRYCGQSVRPVYGALAPVEPVNLSDAETANCYIVNKQGVYHFKATVKGNSTEPVGTPSSASLVWKSFGTDKIPSDGDLVYNVQLKEDQIYFNATAQKGNAVIAVKDSEGKILWSWHIWLTDTPADETYQNGAGTMMDRNLGATSTTGAGALGLLYQWGRKDPFLSSSNASSTVQASSTLFSWSTLTGPRTPDQAVENPSAFIIGNTYNDWTSTDNSLWTSSKSKYDPCPPGYRVPDGGETGFWKTAGFDTATRSSYNGGYWLQVLDGNGQTWYPAAGYIYSGDRSLGHTGSYGAYWTCQTMGYVANCFALGSNNFDSNDRSSRADALSVRPLKIDKK